MSNYFNSMMFNPQYVNPNYYSQIQQNNYNMEQNKKVFDAVKATHELCQAVKYMDEQHQQEAFKACLETLAQEFGW